MTTSWTKQERFLAWDRPLSLFMSNSISSPTALRSVFFLVSKEVSVDGKAFLLWKLSKSEMIIFTGSKILWVTDLYAYLSWIKALSCIHSWSKRTNESLSLPCMISMRSKGFWWTKLRTESKNFCIVEFSLVKFGHHHATLSLFVRLEWLDIRVCNRLWTRQGTHSPEFRLRPRPTMWMEQTLTLKPSEASQSHQSTPAKLDWYLCSKVSMTNPHIFCSSNSSTPRELWYLEISTGCTHCLEAMLNWEKPSVSTKFLSLLPRRRIWLEISIASKSKWPTPEPKMRRVLPLAYTLQFWMQIHQLKTSASSLSTTPTTGFLLFLMRFLMCKCLLQCIIILLAPHLSSKDGMWWILR